MRSAPLQDLRLTIVTPDSIPDRHAILPGSFSCTEREREREKVFSHCLGSLVQYFYALHMQTCRMPVQGCGRGGGVLKVWKHVQLGKDPEDIAYTDHKHHLGHES